MRMSLRIAGRVELNGGYDEEMATIHISEAEAARDFAGLMARVRDGVEVVIESGTQPVAILRAADPPRRSISESIALAEAYSKELGYEPVMDAEFAADMEEIIRNRKPRDTSAWD
jgi:antitoxin (DNA-binding transcriptional repressor) of toxin-antitoxin stability system